MLSVRNGGESVFKFFCTSLLGLAKISQSDAFYYWAVTVDTTDNAVWRY
jgi:hypothetical protein